MLQEEVLEILDGVFKREPSLFLLDLKVSPDNQIRITLDGDHGVSVQDCMAVSRAVEQGIDRETVDFSLEVSSAGATSSLKQARQFTKNIGRKLMVRTAAGSLEGTLTAVTGEGITLQWKAREPKPVGKGKVTVQKKQQIALSEIEEAKVVLKF